MRVATLLTALSLAAFSAAQRPNEIHEATIWDAYQNLRVGGDTFVFEVRGTETVGNSTVPVHAVLYWRTSVDPRTGVKTRAEVELDVFRPNSTVPSMRIVGDGTSLYRYDLDRNTVTTTTYGFYGERPPQGYGTTLEYDAPKLQVQLRKATPGLPTYLARLVSEINLTQYSKESRLDPQYASWSPGARPLAFDEVPLGRRVLNGVLTTDDMVTDPITNRPHVRGTDRFVFYGMDQRAPSRTVAFRLYDADTDEDRERWEVMSVTLALRSPGRVVDLTLVPRTGTVPAWAFRPYTGAQGAAFRPVTPER